MGVVYKIKDQISDFVLEQKMANPSISCRNLALLIEEKLQVKVSKSSINAIMKTAGMSSPVGRTQKRRRRALMAPVLPRPAEEPILPAQEASQAPVAAQKQPFFPPVEVEAPEPAQEQPEAPLPLEPQPLISKPETADYTVSDSERECSGFILLKAVDHLLGASRQIEYTLLNKARLQDRMLKNKIECLLYYSLFDTIDKNGTQELAWLNTLVDSQETSTSIKSYLNELQSVKALDIDILGIITDIFQEVHYMKAQISDRNVFYLDARFYTVWSTPSLPTNFSTTLDITKLYVDKYFNQNAPFILYTAPGYEFPTKEFLTFILALRGEEKEVTELTLYGEKSEEIETFSLPSKRRQAIFGLWPWQYVQYRKVKKLGEFRPHYVKALNKDFLIAEAVIEISQPDGKQHVTLSGLALKTQPNEKTRLLILSTMSPALLAPEQLLELYLGYWPNLEEGFSDFSRKIELFTYTGAATQPLSTSISLLLRETGPGVKALFLSYAQALSEYLKCRILPTGYEANLFPAIKERLLRLKATLKKEKDQDTITFYPGEDSALRGDITYTCNRLNEHQVMFLEGRRAHFRVV